MISGATRGAGGRALGAHVANAEANEEVRMGPSRGLVTDTIRDQVAELTELGSHARTRQPLYHVHLDPHPDHEWTDAQRERYWQRFEREFGLERAPFASQFHTKGGRTHEHREYLRVRPDGTAIRLDHDFARREKLGRIAEHEAGLPFVPGAHNRAVAAALEREGRADIAEAMREAGLLDRRRPEAKTTPEQRQQAERTGVDPRAVGAAALAAWRASDDGRSQRAALEERGLRLAQGDRAAILVDATGNVHAFGRVLGKAAKEETGERIRADEVAKRLEGLDLPRLGGRHAEDRLANLPEAPAEPIASVKARQDASASAPAIDSADRPETPDTKAAPEAVQAPVQDASAPEPVSPVENGTGEMPAQAMTANPAGGEGTAPAPAAPKRPAGGAGGGEAKADTSAVEAEVLDFDPNDMDAAGKFMRAWAAAEKRHRAKEAAANPEHKAGGQHGGHGHEQHRRPEVVNGGEAQGATGRPDPPARLAALTRRAQRLTAPPAPAQIPTWPVGPSSRERFAAEFARLRAQIASRPPDPRHVASSMLDGPGQVLDLAQRRVEELRRTLDERPRGLLDRLGVGRGAHERRDLERQLGEAIDRYDAAREDYCDACHQAETVAPRRAQANREANRRDQQRLDALEAGLRAARSGDPAAQDAARRGDVERLVREGQRKLEEQRRREERERLERQAKANATDLNHDAKIGVSPRPGPALGRR